MQNKIIYFIIFFIFSTISFASEKNYFMMLKYSKVNVRYGPSRDHPIKFIYKKTFLPVKVIDKKENFRKIIDHKKNNGWIHISQLKKINSLIVLSDRLVFKKPTKNSKPIVNIKKGRLLLLKNCKKEWCEIKSEDVSGWIKTNNVWGKNKIIN